MFCLNSRLIDIRIAFKHFAKMKQELNCPTVIKGRIVAILMLCVIDCFTPMNNEVTISVIGVTILCEHSLVNQEDRLCY